MLLASTAVDAQLGGLIKKKAGEVLTKKPEAPPAPAAGSGAGSDARDDDGPRHASSFANGRAGQERGDTSCGEEGRGVAARRERVAGASVGHRRCFVATTNHEPTAIGIICRPSLPPPRPRLTPSATRRRSRSSKRSERR